MQTPREAFFLLQPERYVAFRAANAERIRSGVSSLTKRSEMAEQYVQLAHETLYLSIARYSLGDELIDIQETFLQSLEAWRQARKLNGPVPDLTDRAAYHRALWTLALAILLGFSTNDIEQIVHDLDLREKDGFLDLLLPGSTNRRRKLLHPHPYQHLVDALFGPEDREKEIDRFLKSYYAAQEACDWYDRHVDHEEEFFGYWSFELAGLVGLYEWSDQSFIDNLFYPRDLVHQRLYRTWQDDETGSQDREIVEILENPLFDPEELGRQIMEGRSTEAFDSKDYFEQLTGLSPEQIEDHPDQMHQWIQQLTAKLLESVRQLRRQVRKPGPEMQAFITQIKDVTPETDAQNPDSKASTEQYLAEYLESLGELEGDLDRERQQQQGDQSVVTTMERFGELMQKYVGLVPHVPATDPELQRRVEENIDQHLEEVRQKRGDQPFDWTDLLE